MIIGSISIDEMFDQERFTEIIEKSQTKPFELQYICILFKSIHEHIKVTNKSALTVQNEFKEILKLDPINIYSNDPKMIKAILKLQHKNLTIIG